MLGKNKNLILVRASATSLHQGWLLPYNWRNWDIIVNYFGDSPCPFKDRDVSLILSKNTKWPAIYELLSQERLPWKNYEYIWFPDDDLQFSGHDANQYFDICRQANLDISQPSLSPRSYFSHLITLYNPNFILRKTNFIEVMAPCFSTRMLTECMNTFRESRSGWGLDYVWQDILSRNGRRSAIVDLVQITHTRPIGGPVYTTLSREGISPEQELSTLLARYGIKNTRQIVTSGITFNGEVLSITGDSGSRLIEILKEGWDALGDTPPHKLQQLINDHREISASLHNNLSKTEKTTISLDGVVNLPPPMFR